MLETPEKVRHAWDAIAAGYSCHVTQSHSDLAEEALRRAGVGRGTVFLDVAAGCGALSIPAARLGARVLATDISPGMLGELRLRAQAEGLDGIQTQTMDGHALALEEASFEVAGSQFGVMLFADMPRGIREMARVTRPGGRVLVIAFGEPREVEFLVFFVRAVQSVIPGFTGPLDAPPPPFQLRDPERLRRELSGAGLRAAEVHCIQERQEFASGGALWDWLLNSNPIPGAVLDQLRLTPEQRARVRDRLEELVRERARGEGKAVLTSAVNIGIGTK